MQMPRLWNSNYTKIWLGNFMIFFSFMLLTPLLPLYLYDTFGADKHTIGLVLSGYTIMALITRMFSGYLVDSFPRRVVLIVSFALFFAFFAGYIVAGSLLLFAIVRTLHGAPFGSVTVANSTVAIDVLHPERRAEGIGYYGLSNNVATAISPSVALWIYNETGDFNVLFLISMLVAAVGMVIDATVKMPKRELIRDKAPLSFDRFFLLDGWRQALSMMCFSLSYGVVSTYVAIYGRQKLGIEGGSGFFFLLLAIGLIISRLTGGRKLRQGLVTRNAAVGMSISLCGYFLFALVPNEIGYYGAALIVGLGNGHMYPAYQTMFINLAPNSRRGTANSSLLVSWDVGIGLGTLIGGVVAQYVSYMAAFLVAAFVNLVGVLIFFILIKNHYNAHKLR
ncbi:MAG: MFS transporter [Marinilabiliaceae bacterium]|jgi:predicted MFS family arabinose efflux permease|nr:MFS transporter [Bacteroidales bacterium]MCR5697191.1 MFS transporter [Marinilabiliaceae bacterium]